MIKHNFKILFDKYRLTVVKENCNLTNFKDKDKDF